MHSWSIYQVPTTSLHTTPSTHLISIQYLRRSMQTIMSIPHLLSLPAKVRNSIYRESLISESQPLSIPPTNNPALCQVSKQLCREAWLIFLSCNDFKISSTTLVVHKPIRKNLACMSHLRHLTLRGGQTRFRSARAAHEIFIFCSIKQQVPQSDHRVRKLLVSTTADGQYRYATIYRSR